MNIDNYQYWESDAASYSDEVDSDAPIHEEHSVVKQLDEDPDCYLAEGLNWGEAFSTSILKSSRFGVPLQYAQMEEDSGLVPFEAVGEIPGVPDHEVKIPEELRDRSVMRKKWSVVDTSDISSWEQEFPVEERAMVHPFELDDFQKRAIRRVEQHQHVVVAAHTSAGKTACAEYAISKAAKEGYRVIYTSPIKALSNQKFREFSNMFESVGIVTGDTQVNPDAQCLIITTEILRTLLYRGDPIIDEIGYVIFDEVHYINDLERGLVWEECIILLPQTVSMVMLSATASNVIEFAEWVGHAKEREVFVVQTLYRPVPLTHRIKIGKEEFPLTDASGLFNVIAYRNHMEQERAKEKRKLELDKAKAKSKQKGKAKTQSKAPIKRNYMKDMKAEAANIQSFIRRLDDEDRLPAIVFSFSRDRCMSYATSMPNLDLLTSSEERSKVTIFLNEVLNVIPEADRELPQVYLIFDLLKRGIGIHHGGLLPLVKESVEILFGRGLVKCLFATETFAMGVNMPARSVIFTSITKHDGRSKRLLLPSEYIQMAGRAGRRGKDTIGYVYLLLNELPGSSELASMLRFKNDPLVSKFRLTMLGLLNFCLKSNSIRAEDLLAKSFNESERAASLPILRKRMAKAKHMLTLVPEYFCLCEGARHYNNIFKNLIAVQNQLARNGLTDATHITVGSLVLINPKGLGLGGAPLYAVVIHLETEVMDPIQKTGRISLLVVNLHTEETTCNAILSPCEIRTFGDNGYPVAYHSTLASDNNVVPIRWTLVTGFQAVNLICLLDNKVISTDNAKIEPLGQSVQRSKRRLEQDMKVSLSQHQIAVDDIESELEDQFALKQAVPILKFDTADKTIDLETLNDLARDVKVAIDTPDLSLLDVKHKLLSSNIHLTDTILQQKSLYSSLISNPAHRCPNLRAHMDVELQHYATTNELEISKAATQDDSLKLFDDLHNKRRFLQQINFISHKSNITIKGRTAIELLIGDEVIIPELLFDGIFNQCSPEELAAMLATFVAPGRKQGTNSESLEIPESLIEKLEVAEKLHWDLGNKAMALNCIMSEEGWESIMNLTMAPIAYHWAKGMKFSELVLSAHLDEGSIVRMITRCEELIRKVGSAAKLLNNEEVMMKCEQAEVLVRRDIIFCPSLYLLRSMRSA